MDQTVERRVGAADDRWLRRFGWTVLLLPPCFVLALPLVTTLVLEPRWPHRGHLAAAAASAVLVMGFGLAMVWLVSRAHARSTELQERTSRAERHTAVLVERERIAREMHDSLAQVLAVAHLRLRVLESSPSLSGLADERAELADLAALCQESVRDVRETILGLRSDTAVERPFSEVLQGFVDAFSRSTGIAATLACDPPALDLPPEQRLQASRVVQEALANVRKHSGASMVGVTIATTATGTRIVVRDDGRGFRVGQDGRHDSFGLHTMRERITQVHGRLDVVSAPGEGTSVVACLPPTEEDHR